MRALHPLTVIVLATASGTGCFLERAALSASDVDAGQRPDAFVPGDGGVREDAGPPPRDSGPGCTATGPEVCDPDERDEDCDGARNEGCVCTLEMTRSCTHASGCEGTEACLGTAWGECAPTLAPPSCNGMDDDCDGTIDDASDCATATGCAFFTWMNSSYLICDFDRTFDGAQAFCSEHGYSLATVGDASEDEALLAEADRLYGNDRWWIGYEDRDGDGTYRWVSGSSSYENPSFPSGTGSCAVMDTNPNDWGDESCGSNQRFICEVSRP